MNYGDLGFDFSITLRTTDGLSKGGVDDGTATTTTRKREGSGVVW